MIIGYVFSRKDNKEFEIARGSPGNEHEYFKKLYVLFKDYIFKQEEKK